MRLIHDALQALGVKCKPAEPSPSDSSTLLLRLRVGGFDRRKEMFKGWVEVEDFVYRGQEGSFCVMQRDQVPFQFPFIIFCDSRPSPSQGNPISWRQLWKALIKYQTVEPHVLRR